MDLLDPTLHIGLAVVVFVALALVAMVVLRALGLDLRDPDRRFDVTAMGVAAAVNVLVMVTVIAMFVWWDGHAWTDLGVAFGGRQALYSVLVLVGTFGVALGYTTLLKRRGSVVLARKSFAVPRPPTAMIAATLVALFLAALQEEVVFRAYVLSQLQAVGWLAAVAVSAVVFTAVHYLTNRGGVYPTLSWLMGGVGLAAVYLLSGSIWPAAIAHFGRNLANVTVLSDEQGLGLFEYERGLSPAQWTGEHLVYTVGTIVLAVLVFGS